MGLGIEIIILAVVLLAVVAIVFWFLSIYNSLVMLKNNIKKAWANIDVLLMQRSSELPKLVDSVKGYMKYEKGVLESVTKARTAFLDAKTIGQKAAADNMLSGALKTLFAVSENYPQLKASDNFQQLQSRISDIENQISDRREFYNDSVNTYNIRINQMPDSIIAGMLHYQDETLFQATEEQKKDVKIEF